MDIGNFYSDSSGEIVFTKEQSSDFAKSVAGDFNPLHDPESRRFCVPGDLLFAVFLHRHGVYSSMSFDFQNMVDASAALIEVQEGQCTRLLDAKQREYLVVNTDGDRSEDPPLVQGLTQAYVAFSGQTFPYLLVDLMRRHEVMINPARPLVIYKSMQLNVEQLDASDVSLHFSGSELEHSGKKGTVNLNFQINSGDRQIGTGQKQMVLGGLRPYQEDVMDALVEEYQSIKGKFEQTV